ncbi:hypothetical protein WJX81_002248 [Elliptochloris bilobata]|uniref:Uncharacterized protein n=1 Tax=Elliptochloris bilobata TaxID=381761 RepID=A0AAW1RT60_9CHLO
MSLLGIVKNFLRPATAGGHDGPRSAQPAHESRFRDPSFDEEDAIELELACLLAQLEQQSAEAKSVRSAQRVLFARFVEVYEAWQPVDAPPASAGVPPTPTLVAALHNLRSDFAEVARREHASASELASGLNMGALEALRISARSAANRAALLQLDVLPALAGLLKAGTSRLGTLAAVADVAGDAAALAPQLWLAQCLLARTVAALDAWVAGEACHALGAVPHDADELPRSCYDCQPLREPGTPAQAAALEAALRPVLEAQTPAALLELLRLLARLRARGAPVVAEWEAAALRCLAALMAACAPATAALLEHGGGAASGLQALMEGLGWPTAADEQDGVLRPVLPAADPGRAAHEPVPTQGCVRTAEEELQAQLATLQLVGAAMKYSRAALAAFQDGGGFGRVTHLLQWAALAVARTEGYDTGARGAGRAAGNGNGGPQQGLGDPSHSAALRSSGFASMSAPGAGGLPGDGAPRPPPLRVRPPTLPCPELGALFDVLAGWADLCAPGSVAHRTPSDHRDRLSRHVAAALLDLHALRLLERLLLAEPGALPALRWMGLWDGGGERSNEADPNPKFDPESDPTLQTCALERAAEVRAAVVALTERAAAAEGLEDSGPECSKLLDALGQLTDPRLVLLAAPALACLLHAAPAATVSALSAAGALRRLADAVAWQQCAEQACANGGSAAQATGAGGGASEAPESLAWQARCSVLGLLAAFLRADAVVRRAAMREAEVVSALLALVWDARMRAAALSLVAGLMKTPPAAHDDRTAKAVLFSRFTQLLPGALAVDGALGKGPGRPLVDDLLEVIRDVVTHDPAPHQSLFRHADAFVQLVHLLNVTADSSTGAPAAARTGSNGALDPYPNPDGSRSGAALCGEVLATITALVAGNAASRARVAQDIGYDQILTVVLRQVQPDGPSESLLLAVLGLLLEAPYEAEGPSQEVANADALPLLLALLREGRPAVQAWGLAALLRVLRGSTANLSACDRVGVNGRLIEWLAAAAERPALQAQIAEVLQVTGAFSISGRDLRALSALLREDNSGRVPRHTMLLLRLLAAVARHEGPTAFFDFSGGAGGIMRSGDLRLPGGKGYSFMAWLRLEAVERAPHRAGRALFSLLCRSGGPVRGVAAAVRGDRLVMRCLAPKLHEAELAFRFQAQRWYHVVLTHSSGGAVASSWLRLFVNGTLEASARTRYPKVAEPLNACSLAARVAEPLNACSLAARVDACESGLGTAVEGLHGQLGAVHFFDDVLSPGQATALFEMGLDGQARFAAAEADGSPAQGGALAAAALGPAGRGALATRLMLSYNPQASAGRLLYDTAGGDAAALLEGSWLCCTRQLRDLLPCLGGVAVLLPLLEQLDAPAGDAGTGEPSRAVAVLQLLAAVLEESPSNRQSFAQLSGAELVAHLLQRASARHLVPSLLRAGEELARAVRPAPALAAAVQKHLLLSVRLWAAAPLPTQRNLLAVMLQLAKADPPAVAEALAGPRLLDAIREHYGTPGAAALPEAGRPAAGRGLAGADVRALRQGLLKTALVVMQRAALPAAASATRAASDVQALVAFVGDCADAPMLEDVLVTLAALLAHTPPGRQPALSGLGGARLVVSLLSREQPALRMLGLRLLAICLRRDRGPGSAGSGSGLRSEGAASEDAAAAEGMWAAVGDALATFPLTPLTREALLLLACAGSPSGRPGGLLLTAPAVVGVLLRLLQGCDDATERVTTLTALSRLIVDGPRENRAAVLAQPGWDEWLLELLLDSSPRAAGPWGGPEAVLVRGLLSALYRHALAEAPLGWTCLERAACHLRSLGSQGAVNGWGLLHALLADVVDDLLLRIAGDTAATAAATDSWQLVGALSAEPMRSNAVGLLGILDEVTAGGLVAPPGEALAPAVEAVEWAEAGDSGEEIPDAAWQLLGVPAPGGSLPLHRHLGVDTHRLHQGAWQLVCVLARALEGGPPGFPRAARPAGEGLSERGGSGGHSGARGALAAVIAGFGASSPDSPASDASSPGNSERERLARLAGRLLLHFLRCAAPEVAAQCVAELRQALPLLLDAASPWSRARLHLLLAAVWRLGSSQPAASGLPGGRRYVAAQALDELAEAAAAALPDEAVGLPDLPPYYDRAFWDVACMGLAWDQAAAAARSEALLGAHMALCHASAADALAREVDARLRDERAARAAFLGSAREALGLLCAAERARRAAARAAEEEAALGRARAWRDLRRALTGERGLWAQPGCAPEAHWRLDSSEDPSRRRMRLKRNYKFVRYQDAERAPAPQAEPPAASPEPALRTGLSLTGVPLRGPEDEDGPDPDSPGRAPDFPEDARAANAAAVAEGRSTPSPGDAAREGPRETPDRGDPAALAPPQRTEQERELEAEATLAGLEQDPVLFLSHCVLVTPKRVVAGILRLTPRQLHFVGDPHEEQPAEANGAAGSKSPGGRCVRTHRHWELAAIVEVHHQRYLLQPSALEIFLGDRSNALLNLPSSQLMHELAACLAAAAPRAAVLDRRKKLELAAKLQQRWQRWELSNFDYLMQLNTLAGRTYSDLAQYPVFPWVLADYASASLDLNDAATFRDLVKPVGALDDKRLKFFLDRYESLRAQADPDVPPFLYGSHYSSAGAVLFYLIRLDPFSGLARSLQGGRFDHADRLFSSVGAAWRNCLGGSSDVKELIPEFFFLPEFLANADGHHLGVRQDGSELGAVELPPWANGSAHEFVRLHREALECDYVSERLHAWIDLIFGHKQRGRAAEEAANVFYYVTYEGAVSLADIPDLQQRKAVEDQIRHFGQTPAQLFRRRHPRRGPPPPPTAAPLLNGPDAFRLTVVGRPPPDRPAVAVSRVAVADGCVAVVGADRSLAVHRWLPPRDAGAFTFSVPVEAGFAVEADPAPPRALGAPFAADALSGHCYAVLPGSQVVACCGYWDHSIRCYAAEDGRLLQAARAHKDVVTCLALGADGCTLVSGSRDTTVIVWEVALGAVGAQPRGRTRSLGGSSSAGLGQGPIVERPRHVLAGHEDAVACLAVSTDLDLVVSGAADGMLLFHTLRRGRYLRALRLPCGGAAALLALAPGPGLLAAFSAAELALHVFSVNGAPLVSAEVTERLAAMAPSPCGRFLVTGGARGAVTLLWLHSLEGVMRYEGGCGPVTALCVTAEQCIAAGTASGALLVFAPDPRRRLTRRVQLAAARVGARSANASPSKVVRSGG